MRKIYAGLFLIALTTLMLELTLIRVFDVLWYSNMAYMVITLAMFSFGLAGVYSSLRPTKTVEGVRNYVALLALLFGVFALAILPIMHYLPFDFKFLTATPLRALGAFLTIYLALSLPFFLGGLVFTTIFSTYSSNIQRLYFWDLVGAAIGCLILIPFLPIIGPGGLLFLSLAFAFWAAALFTNRQSWRAPIALIGLIAAAVPFIHAATPFLDASGYIDFRPHLDKRAYKVHKNAGKIELTRWDPISKIDIFNLGNPRPKWIAYDGGTQGSFFYPFDGDFAALRNLFESQSGQSSKGVLRRHFWGNIVLLSHYLKRDTGQRVLVIGGAGGQETKAALMFGASHVDVIELVGAVIELGKGEYADYIGRIYNHPKVDARVGEGRTFLRSSNNTYDIIQIMSNHTSSSIAAGTGAMATVYLQTAEAYKEYFTHLADDGILHINHRIYPRMVATAALAWRQLGRRDFQKHVLVFESKGVKDTLPSLLIKTSPWTVREVKEVAALIPWKRLAVDPIHPQNSSLSRDFFTGDFPKELADRIKIRLSPATDNKPFFNFLRKERKIQKVDPDNFMDFSSAGILNSQMRKGVPMDVVHLMVTAAAALFFALIFIFIPLFFSKAGRSRWRRKGSSLIYFGCLGAGFIIFELVFIQIFMRLIGYPLYTYSTVVFAFLFGAGMGSLASNKLDFHTRKTWVVSFAGILVTAALLLFTHSAIFDVFLTSPTWLRVFVSLLLIFPLAFFLGMPFPLGILAIKNQPSGAVSWAWALNGLFTVVGGVASVLLSIYLGLQETLLFAIGIYALAFFMFYRIRQPITT